MASATVWKWRYAAAAAGAAERSAPAGLADMDPGLGAAGFLGLERLQLAGEAALARGQGEDVDHQDGPGDNKSGEEASHGGSSVFGGEHAALAQAGDAVAEQLLAVAHGDQNGHQGQEGGHGEEQRRQHARSEAAIGAAEQHGSRMLAAPPADGHVINGDVGGE